MNFRGHFIGGVAAGCVVDLFALQFQFVKLSVEAIQFFVQNPFAQGVAFGEVHKLFLLFFITVFMALFPDLDVASIPQRWFYRCVFVILLLFMINERHDLFSILALASITPILHHHRGWTHWKITPWILFFFLGCIMEYLRSKNAWLFSSFSWDNVYLYCQNYWPYLAACVLGHYVHLFLDSKNKRWLPFLKNSPNHY